MTKQFINKDKIIEAFIREPYINMKGETTNGWQVVLIVGYDMEGIQTQIITNEESESDCIKKIAKLGLTEI